MSFHKVMATKWLLHFLVQWPVLWPKICHNCSSVLNVSWRQLKLFHVILLINKQKHINIKKWYLDGRHNDQQNNSTELYSNLMLTKTQLTQTDRASAATQYVDGIYDNPVTLKSRLRVTQDHWKWNHWVDHTWLTISRVIWRWILS